jgi:hypothetical protein
MGKTTFELNQPKAASFIDRLFIADENQKRRRNVYEVSIKKLKSKS